MRYKRVTIVTGAIVLGLTAVVLNVDQLYFMSALLLVLPLVGYLIGRSSLQGLECSRQVTDRVFEDGLVRVELEVRNRSRLPKAFVDVEDVLPHWLQPEAPPHFYLPVLWGGESARFAYSARALKRGCFPIGPVQLQATDPLGVTEYRRRVGEAQEAVVYPTALVAVRGEAMDVHPEVAGLAPRAARIGEGVDFSRIRDYLPGDELRRIHWKATARHDRLQVIDFEHTPATSLTLVVDVARRTDVGLGRESTLEYSVKLAASLAHHTLDNGARVTLALRGRRANGIVTAVRSDHYYDLLELLARAEADGETPAATAVVELARTGTLSEAVVVLTAALDPALVEAAREVVLRQARAIIILMDAHSFVGDGPPSPDDPYNRLATALRGVGAEVHRVRRGDDLTRLVGRIIHGAER